MSCEFFKMPWIKSCLCHQEKKKPPSISPPIHLLLKPDGTGTHGPNHAFRCKVFKKPRPCHLCHQPILHQGSCCRVCKYVCHSVCESKEAAERFTDTSWRIHRQWREDHSSKPIAVTVAKPVTKITEISTNPDRKSSESSSSEKKGCDYAIIEPVRNGRKPKEDVKTISDEGMEIERPSSILGETENPVNPDTESVCSCSSENAIAHCNDLCDNSNLHVEFITFDGDEYTVLSNHKRMKWTYRETDV